MNGSVKFFDSRQRYLLFVTTTNEKTVVSEKISTIVHEIKPKKPALKIFDAGVGDGAVLMNVLRSCHDCNNLYFSYLTDPVSGPVIWER